MFDTTAGLGALKIHIGKPDSAQPPEFWAQLAADRIMEVANSAPQPIRDQAYAFKERLKTVIAGSINSAVIERRARDALIAERKDPEIAQMIREDK